MSGSFESLLPRLEYEAGFGVLIDGIVVEFLRPLDVGVDETRSRKLRAAFEKWCGVAAMNHGNIMVCSLVAVPTQDGPCEGYAVFYNDSERGWEFTSDPICMLRCDVEKGYLDWVPEEVVPRLRIGGVRFLRVHTVDAHNFLEGGLLMNAADWPLHPPGHPNEAINGFCCTERWSTFGPKADHAVMDCPTAWRLDIEGREHYRAAAMRRYLASKAARAAAEPAELVGVAA